MDVVISSIYSTDTYSFHLTHIYLASIPDTAYWDMNKKKKNPYLYGVEILVKRQ